MKCTRKSYHARRYPRVAPPENVYLISASDAAKALGCSKASLARWRVLWKKYKPDTDLTPPPGPPPIYITNRICKYRADECFNFGSTFVGRMKAVTASVGVSRSTATAGAR